MLTLLFMFFLPVDASAAKILFNLKGNQQLVEVGAGGGVTSEATVVWDERKDGPLPGDAPVGYAERGIDGSGKPVLAQNPAMKADYDAKVQARLDKEVSDAQDKAAFQALKLKVKEDTATAADVRRMLKFLLQKLGE